MSKTNNKEALPTHVWYVLDRSGSMGGLADEVIGGFEKFIADQKKLPGKCRLTMVQFDTGPVDVLFDAADITGITTLDGFHPRGMTALYDAEGEMIRRAEARAEERKKAGKKPEVNVFVTFTDGGENSSQEWNATSLAAKKAEMEKQGWAFTYVGIGDRAAHRAQAATVGTVAGATQTNSATSKGVSNAYSGVSHSISNVRSNALRGMTTSSAAAYAGYSNAEDEDPLVVSQTSSGLLTATKKASVKPTSRTTKAKTPTSK